jgi:hypothetical protein
MRSSWRDISDLMDAIAYRGERGLNDGPHARTGVRLSLNGLGDPETEEFILEGARHELLRETLGYAIPFRRSRGDRRGLFFGEDLNTGESLLQSPECVRTHVLGYGATGAGKTTFIIMLVLQLVALLKALWLTDMHKREFRHLREPFKRLNRDLVVVRSGDWRINPLQACGCDPRGYLGVIVGILVRVLGLPSRARQILAWACHALYERFGIFAGRTDAWPTLFDAFEMVRVTPGLDHMAKSALLDRLGSLLTSLGPAVLGNRVGWSPLSLSEFPMVHEHAGLPEHAKQLLLNWPLHTLLHSDIQRGVVNSNLQHLILIDDAQRLLVSHQHEDHDLTPMEELLGLSRSTGRAAGFFVQSPDGVPRGIRANCGTQMLFAVNSDPDLRMVAADMGLSPAQIAWAREHLVRGKYVLRSAGSWRHPVALAVPRAVVPPTTSDADVVRSHASLRRLPVVPASEFADWTMHPVIVVRGERGNSQAPGSAPVPSVTPHTTAIPVAAAPTVPPTVASTPSIPPSLTPAELALLIAIIESPGTASSELPIRAGISPKKAAELREKLVREGYLRVHRVATGPRGRRAIVLEPLDPARAAVAAHKGQKEAGQ